MRGSWVLVAGLILSGAACAHRRAVSDAGAPQADSVVVNIVNHSAAPMWLFATAPPVQNYLMGTVEPGATSRFVLHFGWLWGRSVEFIAEPRGVPAESFRSGHLHLRPGDIVDFEMTTGASRAAVRLSAIAGTYVLVSIDGHPVPYAPPREADRPADAPPPPTIAGSTFTVNADSTFQLTMSYRMGPPGAERATEGQFSGTYVRQGDGYNFTWKNAGQTPVALRGDTLVLNNVGMLFAYLRQLGR